MAISFRISNQSNRVYLSVTDSFRFPDFFGAWREILQNPNFRPNHTMVWDLSELDASSLLDSDLRRIAEFMQGQLRVNGFSTSVALIAPTKATYGLANSYLTFLLEDQNNFSIFRTLAKGEAWLQTQQKQQEALE